jgi:hypothetical protein
MQSCAIIYARPDNMVGFNCNRLEQLQGKRLEDVAVDALNDLIQQHQVSDRATPRIGAHSSELTALVVLRGVQRAVETTQRALTAKLRAAAKA